MKLRTSLAAAGAAVVLGTTGALVLPAVASAHSGTHTLKFIAVQKATVNFTTATQGVQETDTSTAGKTIGFDMIYVKVTSPSSGSVNATVETNGGFLYGTFTLSQDGAAGQRQGDRRGTGAFAGATGTTSRPRPSPAPSTPSRSPTAADQARQRHLGGTVPPGATVPPCWIKINIQTDPATGWCGVSGQFPQIPVSNQADVAVALVQACS